MTQLTAFHLNNHQADRKLNVTWNGTKLDRTHSPVYLGITLDRSLTYRNHCLKTRAKLSSLNNLPRKLHGTNWGEWPHTMRTTATVSLTMSLRGGVLLSCLTPESTELIEEYREKYVDDPFADNTITFGEELMSAISEERRKAWQTLIESTDMTHNSKKAWSTVRKLCDDPCKP